MEDDKILDAAIKALDKEFGDGTVIDGDSVLSYDKVLPTGSLALDTALGIGGYPMGSIIELYGAPSAGKTTLALHAVAEAQKQGLKCGFVDVEHGLDPDYARSLGVDMATVLISQPTYAEEALTVVDMLSRTGRVGVIVVDSVAALVPKAELEGDVDKDHVARQARIMSQFLRRIAGFVHKTGCLVIFVNQTRQKIGVMFGNPDTTPGGMALKFYSHVRLEVKAIQQIKAGEDPIGNKVRVKVVKNKHAAPFKTSEFDLVFGKGIDSLGELLDLAVGAGLVKKSGAWFKFDDENTVQGRHGAIEYINSDINIETTLYNQIKRQGTEVEEIDETASEPTSEESIPDA
jgi:recombination protein RecA